MFLNFNEELLEQFQELRYRQNKRLSSKVYEAYFTDIIREFPKLREFKESRWPSTFIEAQELRELFDLTSKSTTLEASYFTSEEVYNLSKPLYRANNLEELEQMVKSIILDETNEYNAFIVGANIENNKKELYNKYSDLFETAKNFSKTTNIKAFHSDGSVEIYHRSPGNSKNKLGYRHITSDLFKSYLTKHHPDVYKRIGSEIWTYGSDLLKIVDSKNETIIDFR